MSLLHSDFCARRKKKKKYEKIVLELNSCSIRREKSEWGRGRKVWHICSQELLLTLSRANKYDKH